MGYRSQVGYLIMFTEKEVYDQFKVQYKLDDKFKLCWEDEQNENEYAPRLWFFDDAMYIKFEASDVKWYDEYEDVKCHHALLDLADEYYDKYNCVSWQFVRVGEEEGDIDSRYGGYGDAPSNMYAVSSIHWEV